MAEQGFVGDGVTGGGIARRSMDAGHTVHRYNRTPDRVRELTQFGLELADTPPEVELKLLIFKDRLPAH